MTDTLEINFQDIFLMVEKQLLDTFIQLLKTMPPEMAQSIAYKTLKINEELVVMSFNVKVFEYTETKEHNILATYTIKEFIQILLP